MNRGNVVLKNAKRYETPFRISEQKLSNAIDNAVAKLDKTLEKYGLLYPSGSYCDPTGKKFVMGPNDNWLCGLHTGCFMIAYELCKDRKFFDAAANQMGDFRKRLDAKLNLSDHDVGFTFSPSCVAYYKMTGDESAKKSALEAAEHLYNMSYSQKGGFIVRRLCSEHEDPAWCRTMMDTLLNIPLFYWAYEQTGDKKFLDAANSQVDITNRYLIREDGSSYHHYQFEVDTHKPLYGVTFQGNRNESTWSRGHSWGVLGIPIAYGYTKDEELLRLQRDITYFMLDHLPDDYVPYWDYDFTDGDEPRDSSAGAIAVCGLLEAAKYLPDSAPEKEIYITAAHRMLEGIIDTCTADETDEYDGIIYNVTGARRFNICLGGCAPYGDFFYLEALQRIKNPDWKHMW